MNYSQKLQEYYETDLKISDTKEVELRDKRDTNVSRAVTYLRANDVLVDGTFSQGSYILRTMIHKEPYDLDIGIVISPKEQRSPDEIAYLVKAGIEDDARYSNEAEIKPKCVRVPYENLCIDIPLFKGTKDMRVGAVWNPSTHVELTNHYKQELSVKEHSRRIIQLIKRASNQQKGPSGVVITTLVLKHYQERGTLHETLQEVLSGVEQDVAPVRNPVDSNEVFCEDITAFREFIRDSNIDFSLQPKAVVANLNKFFNTEFFKLDHVVDQSSVPAINKEGPNTYA